MDTYTAHRLILLRAVIQSGSLTQAAAREGLTVSAVSQHMRALERHAGMALLERHSRGVKATEAGLIGHQHAEEIYNSLASFEQNVERLKRGKNGSLTCGIFPTLATSLGPSILNSTRRSPGLTVTLRSARLRELKLMLKQSAIDVALTWDYPWNVDESDGLVRKPVMRDSTVLLVPEYMSTSRWSDHLSPKTKWISRSGGHQVRTLLDMIGRDHRFVPNVVYEANDWAEVQGMVAAGLGIAVAPTLASIPLRPGVVTVPFATSPVRTIYLTRRKNQPPHPGEEVLVSRILDAEDEVVSERR